MSKSRSMNRTVISVLESVSRQKLFGLAQDPLPGRSLAGRCPIHVAGYRKSKFFRLEVRCLDWSPGSKRIDAKSDQGNVILPVEVEHTGWARQSDKIRPSGVSSL